MSRVVIGIYRNKERVSEAVEGLLQASVPVHEISVVLQDESGGERRSARGRVRRRSAAGGLVGAALGALGVSLVATGISVAPDASLAAAGPVLSLLVGGGALTGAAIGTPLGIRRRGTLSDTAVDDLERGAAVVAVHSDQFAGAAREVFVRTGAGALTETWQSGSMEPPTSEYSAMRMSMLQAES